MTTTSEPESEPADFGILDRAEKMDAVDLLADHETVIGQLYTVYAENNPGHAELWNRLAEEEEIHAGVLHKVMKMIRDGETDDEKIQNLFSKLARHTHKHQERLADAIKNYKTPGLLGGLFKRK